MNLLDLYCRISIDTSEFDNGINNASKTFEDFSKIELRVGKILDCEPVKKAKKERRVEEKTVFLLMRDGKIALRKRPKTGLLAGLWEFPNVEGTLDETAAGAAVEAVGLSVIDWQSRLTAKHIFTHVEWRMTGYALTVRGDGPAELEWVDAAGDRKSVV